MKYKFYPSVPFGEINAPPSKSMAHRLIICASLSEGKSEIKNIALSEDIKATVGCMQNFGAKIDICEDTLTVCGTNDFSVREPLFCGESASTLRFLIPLSLVKENKVKFYGSKRLFERPLDEYKKIFEEQKISFSLDESSLTLSGQLKAGEFNISGDISSQYISGLLFALPLLENDSILKINPPFVSKSYVDMTLYTMSLFGVNATRTDEFTFYIKGNQHYFPTDTVCEGDYSNSAFFHALKFIGGNVRVTGLSEKSLQGDRIFEALCESLYNGSPEIDVSNSIDLAPLLFSVSALCNGAVFTNTERLRYKESDRILSMQRELLKFGIKTEISDNRFTVFPSEIKTPSEEIDSHNDHRILMALSLLLIKTGGIIKNAECINKSFPDFFEKTEKLNIKGDILNEYDF